ncbi:hypothetical protein TNCV_1984751 [Trichonephila clavipes]|nr:hypothetical protein TNCV_1984751 [Trichonephila clavipes]
MVKTDSSDHSQTLVPSANFCIVRFGRTFPFSPSKAGLLSLSRLLFSSPKITLLNTRGGSTTCPSSLIIGRPQNSAHGLIRVLFAYGAHNHTLCPVWNVRAPYFSFDIWTFCSSHRLCFLEPFSNHLPRRQCSPLDRLRLLSMGAGTPMSIMTFIQSVVTDPRTNKQ